jgi:uncharacterized protein YjiS (DUF1127 family)
MREAAFFIAGQTGSTGILATILDKAFAAFSALKNRRRLAVLTDLDDHLLADLGVSRDDVRWALDLPFSYDPGVELQKRALRNRQPGWRA